MIVNESKKSNPQIPTEFMWIFRKYKLQRLPTAITNKRIRGLIFLVISSIKPTPKAGKHKIGVLGLLRQNFYYLKNLLSLNRELIQ